MSAVGQELNMWVVVGCKQWVASKGPIVVKAKPVRVITIRSVVARVYVSLSSSTTVNHGQWLVSKSIMDNGWWARVLFQLSQTGAQKVGHC
jgi:hypothetical protein